MRAPRAMVLSWLLAAVSGAGDARSQEDLGVEYSAPSDCPARAEFLIRVRKRTPKGRALREQSAAMRVVVEQSETGYQASLKVAEEGGETSSRDVHGATCREVTEAMALVVALALTEPPASKEPAAAPTSVAAFPAPQRPKPKGGVRPTPERAPNEPKAAPEPKEPSKSAAPALLPLALGMTATASGGIAPSPAWGALVFAEAGRFEGPVLRLGVGARASPFVRRGPGTARFDWWGARLDGCAPLVSTSRSALLGCGSFEGGLLSGHGRGVDDPKDSLDPWAALGALLRPRLAIGDVVLEAEGAAMFPLIRPKYVFDLGSGAEAVNIHEVPFVTWAAGIGAALRLR